MKLIILILTSFFLFPSIAQATPHGDVRLKPLPGTVTLTFDDGPTSKYTPKVLQILRDHHVKATWFVMGNAAKRHPELLRLIERDGHTIGNHTLTHPKLPRLSDQRIKKELLGTSTIIVRITGESPVCLRPPFGLVSPRVKAQANALGMSVIMWQINSFDYNRPGVDKIVRNVVKKARPGDIILLHDGPRARGQTLKALPKIIAGLRRRGIGLSTIC